MKKNSRKELIVVTALSFVMLLVMGYFFSIPISVEYMAPFLTVGLVFMVFAIREVLLEADEDGINWTSPVKVIFLAIAAGFIITVLAGSGMLRSAEYASLLKVDEVKPSEMIIKATDTRTSSKEMALKAANKVLGTEHNGVMVSSQYYVNEYDAAIQEINGEMKWIFPLDYRSFFKWMNQDYIPGYIEVSATNSNAVATIKLDSRIKYSKNGYFATNIDRKFWLVSGMKKVHSHLEISDKGEAFYIGSVLVPSIGFNADEVAEVIVFNAESGYYEVLSPEAAIKNYPWIDRIIPEHISLERINWYGSLQGGFLNALFVGENVKEATSYKGSEVWFTKVNGENYWFTGMTSNTSSDSSLVENIFVDTLTGIGKVVPSPGVTDESGAVQQAEASLGADSIKWDATLPQPQYIDGVFYWIMTVKSDSNLYQKVIAVKGDEITVTFEAETVELLLEKVRGKVVTSSSSVDGETITINKKTYIELLKKIEEINALAKQL